MNMLSLFIFGKIVESIVGSWRMLVIYFVSGLFVILYPYHLIPPQFQ